MFKRTFCTSAAALLLAGAVQAQDRSIIVQSTTSTANSGLYDHLLPIFEEESGIEVNVVAVGTGQAITNAENCDGDLLLVHAKPAEEAFVEAGFGTSRTDLMYNDFVIAGPRIDPAKVRGMNDVVSALRRIAAAFAPFASRGDDSGTHKAERRYWNAAAFDPKPGSGKWYFEAGAGMGATLNLAAAKGAYVLSDRATWLSFKNRARMRIAVQGDPRLFNPYGVILVNSARRPHVKRTAGLRFIDWLTSVAGRTAISKFRLAGQQVFFPAGRK